MQRTTLLGTITFLLGLACITLAAIALGTTRWSYNFSTNIEQGLFEMCDFATTRDNCQPLDQIPDHLRASQVLMVIGTISGLIGTVLAVVVMCGKRKKNVHTAMGVSFASAFVFLLIACAVYTGVNRPTLAANLMRFGYSLWLAWSSVVVSLLATPFAFAAKPDKTYVM